jgi:hypothetical protein
MGEVRFLEIAVDKVRITKKTCAEIGVIEVTVTEIAVKRINADKVGVGDGGTAEVAIDHLAAGEDRVPACYAIEAAPIK